MPNLDSRPSPLAEFRSIETVDPTVLSVFPDRVVVRGGGRPDGRVAALEDVTRVRVRTLLGVSTILVRTAEGTIVADLFSRDEAAAAERFLDQIRSGASAHEGLEAPADAPAA